MAYCIRYIFEDDRPPDLPTLAANLRALDPGYRLEPQQDGGGDILFEDGLIGRAELQRVDDPSTHPQIQSLLEELEVLAEDDETLDTDAASNRLWNATGLLTVEVTWEGDAHSESLEKLNPIWGMLLGTYPGILYAEQEAYYDANGLLLELA